MSADPVEDLVEEMEKMGEDMVPSVFGGLEMSGAEDILRRAAELMADIAKKEQDVSRCDESIGRYGRDFLFAVGDLEKILEMTACPLEEDHLQRLGLHPKKELSPEEKLRRVDELTAEIAKHEKIVDECDESIGRYGRDFLYAVRDLERILSPTACPLSAEERKELGVCRLIPKAAMTPKEWWALNGKKVQRAKKVKAEARRNQSAEERAIVLHRAEHPWKREEFDVEDESGESRRRPLINRVRGIFNKITPTTEKELMEELLTLKIHETEAIDEMISLVFLQAVEGPKYAQLFSRILRAVATTEEGAGRIRDAILRRVQTAFAMTAEEYLVKFNLLASVDEHARYYTRNRKRGSAKFIGVLYNHSLVSARIVLHCVTGLLQSVTTRVDGGAADSDAVECALLLLANAGKQLQQRAEKPDPLADPPFPMDSVFATLDKAMPLVCGRARHLIVSLKELRAAGWVPRRKEEWPRPIDEMRKEMQEEKEKKEKREAEAARRRPKDESSESKKVDKAMVVRRGSRDKSVPARRLTEESRSEKKKEEKRDKSVQPVSRPPKEKKMINKLTGEQLTREEWAEMWKNIEERRLAREEMIAKKGEMSESKKVDKVMVVRRESRDKSVPAKRLTEESRSEKTKVEKRDKSVQPVSRPPKEKKMIDKWTGEQLTREEWAEKWKKINEKKRLMKEEGESKKEEKRRIRKEREMEINGELVHYELLRASSPWLREDIDERDESEESRRKLLIKRVRLLLNTITARTEEALTRQFLAYSVHESPRGLEEIVSIVFDLCVRDARLCPLLMRLCCRQMVAEQNGLSGGFSRLQDALFCRVQRAWEEEAVGGGGEMDSCRATGGLASSLSPSDNSATTTPNGTMLDSDPMYEFEIPNSLVGLVIGVRGKTIQELNGRNEVRTMIRQHHEQGKANTHQICQVRGKLENIDRCLQMLRKRFPPTRYPELNLQPVQPANPADLLKAQPSWTVLDVNNNREVVAADREEASWRRRGCCVLIGQMYAHRLACSGLVEYCVTALLRSVRSEEGEVDNASVECGLQLLAAAGARLHEETQQLRQLLLQPMSLHVPDRPPFPMSAVMAALRAAQPRAAFVVRCQIEELVALRANGWKAAEAEEEAGPRPIDNTKAGSARKTDTVAKKDPRLSKKDMMFAAKNDKNWRE